MPEGHSLDFVRTRLAEAEKTNAALRTELRESERRLTVLQTAQTWALDDRTCWSESEAQKIRELTLLLERAHEAEKTVRRAEKLQQLGGTSEQVQRLRHQLQRERQETQHCKKRLAHAFEGAHKLKDENAVLRQVVEQDRANFAAETRRIRHAYQQEVERFRREVEAQTIDSAGKAAALHTISRRVIDDLERLELQLAHVQHPPAHTSL